MMLEIKIIKEKALKSAQIFWYKKNLYGNIQRETFLNPNLYKTPFFIKTQIQPNFTYLNFKKKVGQF